MEPLLKQLRELPSRFSALPAPVRYAGLGAVALIVALSAIALSAGGGEQMQYAFTNLGPEDSAEAAAQLKTAGIPFRVDAGGGALAVPSAKVYDARLLLAAAGLPRGGGAGFELFDRGDLGVSEFTQKINLRRALEGELARTIGHLANVRSARVHISLEEKGLYRDDERRASAAVVLNLQTGRSLGEREISGIRHLIASGVSGLQPESVTIVDGRGTVLSSESMWGEAEAYRQREFEKNLESRLISLLEPAVGAGAVVARVSATLDQTEQTESKEIVDPAGVVRSEHKVSQSQSAGGGVPGGGVGGVAGAAGNSPATPTTPTADVSRGTSTNQDEARTFDVGRTVTHTSAKGARLTKLSVAILVDGQDGKPRSDADLDQLRELARKAVGFDEARGDQLELSSTVFARSNEAETPAAPARFALPGQALWWQIGGAAAVLLVIAFFAMRGGGSRDAHASNMRDVALMKPGERVAALEAVLATAATPGLAPTPELTDAAPDASINMRDRARALVEADPARAALLLRAWISSDEATRG